MKNPELKHYYKEDQIDTLTYTRQLQKILLEIKAKEPYTKSMTYRHIVKQIIAENPMHNALIDELEESITNALNGKTN